MIQDPTRPKNWKAVKREIRKLLVAAYPGWEYKLFITISFCTVPLETNPEDFPLLSEKSPSVRKRWIGQFFSDRKWIRYSDGAVMNPKGVKQ